MDDNGEKILEELSEVIENYIDLLDEDTHGGLLIIHRVILMLVELHEQTMREYGIGEDQFEFNREILEQAKQILDNELNWGITMPGGDA